MAFPKYIEVALIYPYITGDVVYVFPRRRKIDSELDERERLLGDGKKLRSSQRLAGMVENVVNFPDFQPRGEDEALNVFQERVARFFGVDEEMEEFANDALVGRDTAIYPRATFRSTEDHRVEVHLRGEQAGGVPVAGVPEVHATGTRPEGGMPQVPVDPGPAKP